MSPWKLCFSCRLYVFRNILFFKILVCGGDGSVGWALSCLDNVGQDAQCQSPPMAVIPLGTGHMIAIFLRLTCYARMHIVMYRAMIGSVLVGCRFFC